MRASVNTTHNHTSLTRCMNVRLQKLMRRGVQPTTAVLNCVLPVRMLSATMVYDMIPVSTMMNVVKLSQDAHRSLLAEVCLSVLRRLSLQAVSPSQPPSFFGNHIKLGHALTTRLCRRKRGSLRCVTSYPLKESKRFQTILFHMIRKPLSYLLEEFWSLSSEESKLYQDI